LVCSGRGTCAPSRVCICNYGLSGNECDINIIAIIVEIVFICIVFALVFFVGCFTLLFGLIAIIVFIVRKLINRKGYKQIQNK
jgi:hypothetical protein